jgi:capsular exopolysaccharide synthesis family protein
MNPAKDTAAPAPAAEERGGTFIPGAVSIPDLFAQLRMLWRHRVLMLLCIVLIPAAVYAWSASKPKVYQSSALIQVQAQSVDTSLFSTPQQSSEEALNASARLAKTGAMAEVAARYLRPRPTEPRSLLGQIATEPDIESGFITITATDSDPDRAAAIANAFAQAVRTTRAEKARTQIDPAVAALRRDLEQLNPNDPADKVQRFQLSQQLQRLRAIRAAQGNNAQVVEPATSGDPVSPNPVRNTLMALILSVFVGVALVFVVDGLDRRIRSVDELEGIGRVPLLGIVPLPNTNGYKRLEAVEAFRMLRASLTYFNVDRQLRIVVVSSPLKGDGKTTVVTNLGEAIARTGKDVILVDADLHQSQVASRFGKSAELGLASVLVGECTLEGALIDIELDDGRMRVLPGGVRPPNPSELLASHEMRQLLTRLSSMTELVIVDTPPTLQVSDAIPLFERASGVVMIARLGKTTRDAMRRLVSVIETSGGTPLGVVATGSKTSNLYGYGAYGGYGWGYKQYGDETSSLATSMRNGAKPA